MDADCENDYQGPGVDFLREVLRKEQGEDEQMRVHDTHATDVAGLGRRPDALVAPCHVEPTAALISGFVEFKVSDKKIGTAETNGQVGTCIVRAMAAQVDRLFMFSLAMAKNKIQLFVGWRTGTAGDVLWTATAPVNMFVAEHDDTLVFTDTASLFLGTWVKGVLNVRLIPKVPGCKIRRLLGTGAFGRVFQGDLDGGLEVTIKVAGAHSSGSLCLKNEAHVLAQLKGVEGVPQIVPAAHSLAQLEGVEGVAQIEPVEGESMFLVTTPVGDPLPSTATPMTFTRKRAVQLFDILKSIHGKGYAHGDVRPANIVYHNDGILLVDYGGAQPLDTDPGMYVGTFTTASDSILDALASRRAMPHVKPVDDVISAVRTIALFTLPDMWAACRQVRRDDAKAMKDFWASSPQFWKNIVEEVTKATTRPSIYDVGKRVCDMLFETPFGGDLATALYPLPPVVVDQKALAEEPAGAGAGADGGNID